ncbi:hypothetical protein [Halorientalis halophila]|uniref:hypothetical protein n=1 Tax=Halorientalis halophila TaxID=3108499 RepID=UPI0030099B1F
MTLGSWAPSVAVALILLGTLASGPLAIASDRNERVDGVGSGSITVEDVTLPETVALRQGRYGEDSYYVDVPDAHVQIAALEGRPVLTYKLAIPELSYTRESAFFLGPETGSKMTLSLQRDQLPPEEVTNDSYAGELRVVDRTGDESRVLANQTVTVEVKR